MSYEPKVQVVRCLYEHAHGSGWRTTEWDPESANDDERAYLVRGLPMPGQRVVGISGRAFTVEGLANPMVVLDDGGVEYARVLHPYDPYDPDEALVAKAVDHVAERMYGVHLTESKVLSLVRDAVQQTIAAMRGDE